MGSGGSWSVLVSYFVMRVLTFQYDEAKNSIRMCILRQMLCVNRSSSSREIEITGYLSTMPQFPKYLVSDVTASQFWNEGIHEFDERMNTQEGAVKLGNPMVRWTSYM